MRARKKKPLVKLVVSSGRERMSHSEIQSWVLATDKVGDDFDDDEYEPSPTLMDIGPVEEWQAFLSLARCRVMQTSTRARIAFLTEKMLGVIQRGGKYILSPWMLLANHEKIY